MHMHPQQLFDPLHPLLSCLVEKSINAFTISCFDSSFHENLLLLKMRMVGCSLRAHPTTRFNREKCNPGNAVVWEDEGERWRHKTLLVDKAAIYERRHSLYMYNVNVNHGFNV